ncbi:AAA family ATPase [Paenibacillus sp. YYML68]|uniref:AAA family ATPase n=1 Tax=Paenibacillus sp. YYML68 TaxID=2909250 RepID=UPI002491040F|nr:AAA family ATPase [Paenibacillus sp. YYML68]
MSHKVIDVFSTSRLSRYSYVSRKYKHNQTFDDFLENYLHENDKIISITGPTKCGKTTLTKSVIDPSALVRIHGADITSPDKLWELVLAKLKTPIESKETKGRDTENEVGGEVSSSGPLSWLWGLGAKGTYKWKGKKTHTLQLDKKQSDHQNAIRNMIERKSVLVIDDFHYITPEVQKEICRQLKGDLESDHPPIVVCSIPSREDATTRALSELQGRVASIKFSRWSNDDLYEIIEKGFHSLNYHVSNKTEIQEYLLHEALGSPHVVQDCCKSICSQKEITQGRTKFFAKEKINFSQAEMKKSLEDVASELHYERSYKIIEDGLPTKGTKRVLHVVGDGDEQDEADVYQLLLKALELDPPKDRLTRNEIDNRISQLVRGKPPARSSIGAVLKNLNRLVLDSNIRNMVLDWDEGTGSGELIIMDPLFLLYLRHGNKS